MNRQTEIFRFQDDDLSRMLDQIQAFQPPVNPYLKLQADEIQYLLRVNEASFDDKSIYKKMHAAFKSHFCDLETIFEIRDLLRRTELSMILNECGYNQLYTENSNSSQSDTKCFSTTEFSQRNQKSYKWVIIKVLIEHLVH